jgi:hypothetical protein
MIQKKGLQQDIQPILIIFTGNGNVSQAIPTLTWLIFRELKR